MEVGGPATEASGRGEAGAPQPRSLTLDGCLNVRDTGGYPVAGGGRTVAHRLLRGDCLHEIGAHGWQVLVSDGVRTVVDLRRPSEARDAPAEPPAGVPVRRLHLPLFGEDDHFGAGAYPDVLSIYRAWLDGHSEAMRTILAAIAASSAAVLVHCWSGKDRTGVVVALVLRLAGVDAATVAADYALTADLLAPRVDEWRDAMVARGEDPGQPVVDARAETMLGLMEHVERAYGGAEGYASAIGLEDSEIGALRTLLLAERV